MSITLSPKTQELIEERMREMGFTNSDDFIQELILQYHPGEELSYDDLDSETRAAIERAEIQPDISAEEAEHRIFDRAFKKQ